MVSKKSDACGGTAWADERRVMCVTDPRAFYYDGVDRLVSVPERERFTVNIDMIIKLLVI